MSTADLTDQEFCDMVRLRSAVSDANRADLCGLVIEATDRLAAAIRRNAIATDTPDPWAAYRDRMIRQIREGIEWLGVDAFVEVLLDYWPGDVEYGAIGPDWLGEVLKTWLKEKES